MRPAARRRPSPLLLALVAALLVASGCAGSGGGGGDSDSADGAELEQVWDETGQAAGRLEELQRASLTLEDGTDSDTGAAPNVTR